MNPSRSGAARFLNRVSRGLFLVLFLGAGAKAQAMEFTQVLNARLLGGQYFFENQESNLSGDIGATYAPAVAFNARWSLLSSFSASWRGTKSVQDLVGGGTLFQQTQDHAASFKGIYSPREAWQFKLGSGYRLQLLKETQDENWDKGLFDYEKPSANFEVERVLSKESGIRLGYDFYWINFRNFSSLESQQRDLGRENAGAKTLNTNNHAPYISYRTPFAFLDQGKGRFEATYYHSFRNFTDQRIVLPTGSLSDTLRKDKNQIFTASALFPFGLREGLKLLTELRAGASLLNSDQNNYDAAKTRFNDNYYSYKEFSAGPVLNFLWGPKPWVFTGGFYYVDRSYDSRPIQDSSGNYGSDKIGIHEYYANFGVAYPVNRNFRVQALGNLGWSRSNMKYEKTYRYNYETLTYLFGVVYDY